MTGRDCLPYDVVTSFGMVSTVKHIFLIVLVLSGLTLVGVKCCMKKCYKGREYHYDPVPDDEFGENLEELNILEKHEIKELVPELKVAKDEIHNTGLAI